MKKNKKVILIGIISIIAISSAIGISYIFSNKNFSESPKQEDNESNVEKDDVIEENMNISEDKKIYVDSNSMFGYEPNLENLYKYADLVVVASFSNNSDIHIDNGMIKTTTEFSVSNILKNNTNLDLKDELSFDVVGGVMNLETYLELAGDASANKFRDIAASERNSYYVIQNTPLELEKDTEYLVFLNIRDNELVLNSSYYGIREISNNKVYDYDTDSFIENDILDLD